MSGDGTKTVLLLGITGSLPSDSGFDDLILLSEGMDELQTEELTDVDLADVEYALSFTTVADGTEDSYDHVMEGWRELGGGSLSLELLTDQVSLMTRSFRRRASKLSAGDVAANSVAVAFKKGNRVARESAINVIRLAALRRRWQLWK